MRQGMHVKLLDLLQKARCERCVWNTLKQVLSLERHKYTLHFSQRVRVREVHPGSLQQRADDKLSTDGQWSYESKRLSTPGIFAAPGDLSVE